MKYPYSFTAYFSTWSKQKVSSSRGTHGLLWNSASRTHVETLTVHVRLVQHCPMILPVTGSVSTPSIDKLALQAFVQISRDRHRQPAASAVSGQTEARVPLESMAPRDSHSISPTKKQHLASLLSCRSSIAFLGYAHLTQRLTSQDLSYMISSPQCPTQGSVFFVPNSNIQG